MSPLLPPLLPKVQRSRTWDPALLQLRRSLSEVRCNDWADVISRERHAAGRAAGAAGRAAAALVVAPTLVWLGAGWPVAVI